VIAGGLVAPIVLSEQGAPTTTSRCVPSLRFQAHLYQRRSTIGRSLTQGIATGVGVLRGCGRAPTNVNVRSLIDIRASRAVAIEGDPDIYVRTGTCGARDGAKLASCLHIATG
jgi:hypothetical protein